MERHAARVDDAHTCPRCGDGTVEREGEGTVLIGNKAAARRGDEATCCGGRAAVVEGNGRVLIGGKAAARKGDATAGGGVVAEGLSSVHIGDGDETAESAKEQPIPQSVRDRLARLPWTAPVDGRCATGVRETLVALYGPKYAWSLDRPKATRTAGNFKEVLDNGGGYDAIPEPADGRYQTGDVRILGNAGKGHVEVYVDGTWSSDFVQQRTSLHNVGENRRYTTSQLYRRRSGG